VEAGPGQEVERVEELDTDPGHPWVRMSGSASARGERVWRK
jgi:hypothetical protein